MLQVSPSLISGISKQNGAPLPPEVSGGFLGDRNLHLGFKRRNWIVEEKGEGVSGGRSSVSRDLERKIHTAYSRTVGSAARGEGCEGEEREAEWNVGGVPKARG